jgi:nucleoside-diphosphate-sugar epimerase
MDKLEKVLILGNNSFVAKGLYEKLSESDNSVHCFTRGSEGRKGDFITGDIMNINSNIYLNEHYDTVINFIILKDESVEKNVLFLQELIKFCNKSGVKRLLQISSIIVYDYKLNFINESTPIDLHKKENTYALIKTEVDKYLESLENQPFSLSLIRPGFVVENKFAVPYFIKLPFNFMVLKGGKKSILPIVYRNDLQDSIKNIVIDGLREKVYLFVPSTNITKYNFMKNNFKTILIPLPENLVMLISRFLFSLKLISKGLLSSITSMFSKVNYNSTITENLTKIKF